MQSSGLKSIRIAPDILSQEVGGETVLLDLNRESYFCMNEVGTRFWQLLKEQDDYGEIVDVLLDEYEVGSDQLCKDLDELLQQLKEVGLLVEENE